MNPAQQRIDEAPRALCAKIRGRLDPALVATDTDRLRVYCEEFLGDAEFEIARVALVEVEEGE